MVRSKIKSYLGFCIKARKIALGSGSIEAIKGKAFLIIVSADGAKNTQKLAIKYMNRFSCPLIVCKFGFEDAVNRPNCKIAAVRDENLANAILENLDDNYQLYAGGSI